MATANPFRFSTKFQDDETGLVNFGFRYCEAGTGRWISKDPVEEWGGLNLYAVGRGNPLSRIDAVGLTDYSLMCGIRTASSYNRPANTPLPLAPAVLLSLIDSMGIRIKSLDQTSWFTNAYSDPGVATEMAKKALSETLNAILCGSRRGSSIAPYVVGPIGGETPANWYFHQSAMESSFVLGYYEYRIVSLCITREGNSIRWAAEVAIIDKMGWERKKYDAVWAWLYDSIYPLSQDPKKAREQMQTAMPQFIEDLNNVAEAFFGRSREFERGKFSISGECCLKK